MTVPIVPGDHDPYTLASVMPAASPPPKRRRWPLIIALVAAGVLTVGAGAAFAYRIGWSPADVLASPLRAAYTDCGEIGRLADNDATLIVDTEGEDAGSGKFSVDQLDCVLQALKAPEYVKAQMWKTRALDGRQSGDWDGFEASWTYHPAQGLDVIIRRK